MQQYVGHCSLIENCINTNTHQRESDHTHQLEVTTVLCVNLNVGCIKVSDMRCTHGLLITPQKVGKIMYSYFSTKCTRQQ